VRSQGRTAAGLALAAFVIFSACTGGGGERAGGRAAPSGGAGGAPSGATGGVGPSPGCAPGVPCAENGQLCTDGRLCLSGFCLPISMKCADPASTRAAGEECDNRCGDEPPSVCTNPPNVSFTCSPGLSCLPTTKCPGSPTLSYACLPPVPLGGVCTSAIVQQCAAGLYCADTTTDPTCAQQTAYACTPLKGEGELCEVTVKQFVAKDGTKLNVPELSQCQDGLTCLVSTDQPMPYNFAQGRCSALNIGEGGACTASPTQQPQCAPGLVCKGTVDASSSITTGTCAKECGTCTGGQSCMADADCPRFCLMQPTVACTGAVGDCGGKDHCPTCDLSMCQLTK